MRHQFHVVGERENSVRASMSYPFTQIPKRALYMKKTIVNFDD